MGKTFEEWWAKLCLKYIEFGGGTEILHQDFKQVAKEAWNASRQNMTTTPGLSFCKDCGGPYSLHHDCKCGNCNG